MIQVNTYVCEKGCMRMSAAPMDKFRGGCCTHGLPFVKVEGTGINVRTAGDPDGTPLVAPAKDSK